MFAREAAYEHWRAQGPVLLLAVKDSTQVEGACTLEQLNPYAAGG